MKRFYKDVTTGPTLDGQGWVVMLDGRPIRTPGKALLAAPTAQMAASLQMEWQAQGDTILPRTMPVTTLLTTCIDRTIPERAAIMQSMLSYLNSDLLCYRAPDDETGLAAEQLRLWDPWLKWFAGRFGHTLKTTTQLLAFNQADDAHMDVSAFVSDLDDHRFNALQVATALSGSIVLALALQERAMTSKQAYDCILCEEQFYERKYKLEKHGLDPIEEKRRASVMEDLDACVQYLGLLN